ncbi:MAG: sugar phosphate isomerase/epimerase [Lentisphaerae bacterium]|jgi:sugar phosphate isomerase/epimerase|nr:sugar phosphate isomerase/epimerase [Lentisphaerota bacterium]MBT4816904.1 sugar phosphate isomerase/epimerase [Lentisphaerota bacterium]MBT5606328.1 sugar phosphate isomerase/epimerase [Lentisphaerota bacterium]MBT7059608.1 sugar phosphate isomerase/epimerase [Lentisphaerota bacterium]MBT7846278.1 sugar phosphate isomerase/epimerase [Lentisphaerota bacterium]
MSIKLGCQTITFGAEQNEDFPAVFAAVARAGYAGVELGFRHIAEIPPTDLKRMLDAEGLTLAGSHIGGNLEDTDQAEGEKKILDQILDYLNAMEVKILMYSGLRGQDDELRGQIDMLNKAAVACRARGVRLCYHNHDWEFADGERIMGTLLEHAAPELAFGPDVGWVYRGGKDVIEFLDAVRDRVAYVHFKDFAGLDGDRRNFVTLGEGGAPLANVADWIKHNAPDVWVVAEQDASELPAAEAVARNGAYLKSLFEG